MSRRPILKSEREAVAQPAAEVGSESWTVAELMARHRVSRATVYRMIGNGTLKSTNQLGGRRIDAASIRALFS